ncbi:hypothetical protein [Saccharothrix xinjiangensis]|uniref:Uncharacterized protein n=1 Tax=Saccharothrix xinjiangensis TaxID=204798 RepID=A0ABV9Y7D4_9PSEU
MTHLRQRPFRELAGLVLTAAVLGAERVLALCAGLGARGSSSSGNDDRWDSALLGGPAVLC